MSGLKCASGLTITLCMNKIIILPYITAHKPLPALLLAPLFSRSLTLVPRSFLLNPTETLATQAKVYVKVNS